MWDFFKNFQERVLGVFTVVKLLGEQFKVSNLGIVRIRSSFLSLKVENGRSGFCRVDPNRFGFCQQLGFLWGV